MDAPLQPSGWRGVVLSTEILRLLEEAGCVIAYRTPAGLDYAAAHLDAPLKRRIEAACSEAFALAELAHQELLRALRPESAA